MTAARSLAWVMLAAGLTLAGPAGAQTPAPKKEKPAGGLGNLGVQILAATTESRIIAVDTDRSRLELAAKHGAHETLVSSADAATSVADLTAGLGVDVVLFSLLEERSSTIVQPRIRLLEY